MLPNIRYILPVLALIILTAMLLISSNDLKFNPARAAALTWQEVETTVTPTLQPVAGFLVHTKGCRIPYFNAFDPSILKYLKSVADLNCSQPALGPFVLSNTTSIWINSSVISEDFENYNCCYRVLVRKVLEKRSKDRKADNQYLESESCVDFEDSANINDEFIKVQCFQNGSIFYEDYHGFVKPKNNVENNQKLNVFIIGADAVSRLNLQRQFPRTLKFLENYLAVNLLGYNKVDDNTYPNLVPVLSGKSVAEISNSCLTDKNDVYDNCPFIWKDFNQAGYQTGFGEDATWMGLFQYLKSGFFKKPVDNYFHTMMHRAEDDIGHSKKFNAKLCVGPRVTAQVLFEYAEKFAVTLTKAKQNFFGLFWGVSMTHDYLNVPPQTDVIYERLLKNLDKNGVFNNTLVVFMSDHGIRWGPIRETYQGRMEERLPFVYFIVPKWFQITYPTAYFNLKRNRRMLTTPFDLYETLKDVLSMDLGPKKINDPLPRGISLFQQIPDRRTCEDAAIPEIWCTCHQSQNISTNDTIVQNATIAVLKHLNEMLAAYIQCAQLTLHEVKSAMLEAPTANVKSSAIRSIQDITVVLVTTPGFAEFEATVRRHLTENKLVVLGSVSRINAYGSQSQCMDNFTMRLYCFCV